MTRSIHINVTVSSLAYKRSSPVILCIVITYAHATENSTFYWPKDVVRKVTEEDDHLYWLSTLCVTLTLIASMANTIQTQESLYNFLWHMLTTLHLLTFDLQEGSSAVNQRNRGDWFSSDILMQSCTGPLWGHLRVLHWFKDGRAKVSVMADVD